jgi:hypothetical protein
MGNLLRFLCALNFVDNSFFADVSKELKKRERERAKTIETISSSGNGVYPGTDAGRNESRRTGEKRRGFQDAERILNTTAALPPPVCSFPRSLLHRPQILPPPRGLSPAPFLCRPSLPPQTLTISPQIQSIDHQSIRARTSSDSRPTPRGADAKAVAGDSSACDRLQNGDATTPSSWRRDESTAATVFKLHAMQGRASHGCSRRPQCSICFYIRYYRRPY